MPGKLSIVATPIGNLADISQRAVDTLDSCDTVLAEDTRVTGKLLAHFGIDTRLERCDENVMERRIPALVDRIAGGEHIAFCSDAGMPGVSDPGARLVDAVREAGLAVEVIPGASAVICALAASGFNTSAFYFGGFLPRKAGERLRLLESLKALDAALIFYESPHRTLAAAKAIAQVFCGREVAMARELTKLHEEVLRLPAEQLAVNLEQREGGLKGEIVLVIGPPRGDEGKPNSGLAEAMERAEVLLATGMRRSTVAKELSEELGISKNVLYDMIHNFEDEKEEHAD